MNNGVPLSMAEESFVGAWGPIHDRLAAADAARKAWLDAHPDNRIDKGQQAYGAKGKGAHATKPVSTAVCSGPDCDRPARSHGLCDTHSRQQRKHGRIWRIAPYQKRKAARP